MHLTPRGDELNELLIELENEHNTQMKDDKRLIKETRFRRTTETNLNGAK